MTALLKSTPHTVQEWGNEFLGLWPHRYDFIVAPFTDEVGDKPEWRTESRYPLSDRQLEQGGQLRGVRFGKETQYCLLDIDADSPYHPHNRPLVLDRLKAALETLGLTQCITCTSSDSGGLHLYFPFTRPQQSWKLASALATALSSKGFKIKTGQLEIFPNTKNYSTTGQLSLFNAHRLPLQEPGSHLLNDALEPIFSSQEKFVSLWKHCQTHNDISQEKIEHFLRSKKRVRHFISQKADSFLNDLNAEIETGWTAHGQTNHLLGRITMRCFIFQHVLDGGEPLSGKTLVDAIVATATALPGYKRWCRHQHEIHKRAIDWTRCIENSHYFPYGSQQGKYKTAQLLNAIEPQQESYNDLKAKATQSKIQQAVEKLETSGKLPATITARFHALTQEHIGGRSLYRYKQLWHPKFDQQRLNKNKTTLVDEGLPSSRGSPSISTSLLGANDGNSSHSKGSAPVDEATIAQEVGNTLSSLHV